MVKPLDGMRMVSPVYVWRALVSKQAGANALHKPVGSTNEQSAYRLCRIHVHKDAEGSPESFDNVGLGSYVFGLSGRRSLVASHGMPLAFR